MSVNMNKLFNIFCLQTTLVILCAKSVYPVNENEENLLENYLPACMQALAYYIDLLQYEPVATTTIEPPFYSEDELTTPTPPRSTTTETTTTRKSTSSWFQSPSWWSSTTTTRKPIPTRKHKPGLYAPLTADQLHINQGSNKNQSKDFANTETQGSTKISENQDYVKQETFDYNILNILPFSLTRDIKKELDDQEQLTEVENLDNFLRSYDDKYGNTNSITGKKRVPPTKPYVEFLLIYDLLKRDAKAFNLSKYEGYTDKLMQDLYELSSSSAQRQMYTLLKRMLDRKEIQRSDVVNRVQSLVKDLGNGNSVISKSLMFYPPLQFIPV
ncbi:uncharacterized protein LOC129948032 [Eupeodes corollae]|uniref:uncharacterized protein LOC129948032 n=1 Tax=Eupeodes corollae TaxID=290404 RepID=UPI00249326C2|nr:uncharacterized protein LOC129948032 [Eupeodes corollae]